MIRRSQAPWPDGPGRAKCRAVGPRRAQYGDAVADTVAPAAAALAERTGVARHDAVVVLGSGWDAATEVLGTLVAELPVAELPGFLAPVAPGHRGLVRSYDLDGLAGAGLPRPHPPVRGPRAGSRSRTRCGSRPRPAARVAVLTNASGGLRADWPPGTGALIADHLNLTFVSPLAGPHFVDLTDAWSPRLRAVARAADPTLVEAVYAQLRGPSVQTVAETAMLRTLGADLVGMSTVVEAIAARGRRARAARALGGDHPRGHRRGSSTRTTSCGSPRRRLGASRG